MSEWVRECVLRAQAVIPDQTRPDQTIPYLFPAVEHPQDPSVIETQAGYALHLRVVLHR